MGLGKLMALMLFVVVMSVTASADVCIGVIADEREVAKSMKELAVKVRGEMGLSKNEIPIIDYWYGDDRYGFGAAGFKKLGISPSHLPCYAILEVNRSDVPLRVVGGAQGVIREASNHSLSAILVLGRWARLNRKPIKRWESTVEAFTPNKVSILAVINDESQDDELLRRIAQIRQASGISDVRLPALSMNLSKDPSFAEDCRRLGFDQGALPCVAIVKTSSAGNYSQIVNGVLFRNFHDGAAAGTAVMERWSQMTGVPLRSASQGGTTASSGRTEAGLPGASESSSSQTTNHTPVDIEVVDFSAEASGKPLYTINVRVKLHNVGQTTAGNIRIKIDYRGIDGYWHTLGTKTLDKLPVGWSIARDFIQDTREYEGLLDAEHNAVACDIKATISFHGKEVVKQIRFRPSEQAIGR